MAQLCKVEWGNLENCDAGISPTNWQKAQHPKAYLDKIMVAHEGIDTENLRPDPNAQIKLPNGQVLKPGDPVITYVARNLEPYRGFHSFMRALPLIQKEHKQCHTVIVGGDEVSYGKRPEGAKNWREKMLAEVGAQLDPTRTHFLGKVPYQTYKTLLQVSATHVYLTYPFVLSWSMLEAMATAALVVGSDTAPVREALTDGHSGFIAAPFDRGSLRSQVLRGLQSKNVELRVAARHDAGRCFNTKDGTAVIDHLCVSTVCQAARATPLTIFDQS